jgi:hypothetical protein
VYLYVTTITSRRMLKRGYAVTGYGCIVYKAHFVPRVVGVIAPRNTFTKLTVHRSVIDLHLVTLYALWITK